MISCVTSSLSLSSERGRNDRKIMKSSSLVNRTLLMILLPSCPLYPHIPARVFCDCTISESVVDVFISHYYRRRRKPFLSDTVERQRESPSRLPSSTAPSPLVLLSTMMIIRDDDGVCLEIASLYHEKRRFLLLSFRKYHPRDHLDDVSLSL
jgi:hypothetical protein